MSSYAEVTDTEKLLSTPPDTSDDRSKRRSARNFGTPHQGETNLRLRICDRVIDLAQLVQLARLHIRLLLVTVVLLSLSIALLIYSLLPGPHPPFPWRDQCRSTFPTHYVLDRIDGGARTLVPLTPNHAVWPYDSPHIPLPGAADGMEPTTVFIGIFTVAAATARRQMIRDTYRRQGVPGVAWVFVLGRAEGTEVEDEAALHGDILFLPIHENMNDGKTYTFFHWAASNARVHVNGYSEVPAYIMKADDDSFIMLEELERRLRVIPRHLAYWGLLMFGEYKQSQSQGEYMTGGGYALSFDLVQHIASDPYPQAHAIGHEDQNVGGWVRAHPRADEVVWMTERCWIYDHPRATGWALSHGFLFPNVVKHIRDHTEHAAGHLPSLPLELQTSWSTVTAWLEPYTYITLGRRHHRSSRHGLKDNPHAHLGTDSSVNQRIEAMVEGSPLSLLHAHNSMYINRTDTHDSASDRPMVTQEEVDKAWGMRVTRESKMEGRDEVGSTVLVHEVKRDEWWIETALALMGDAWTDGSRKGLDDH